MEVPGTMLGTQNNFLPFQGAVSPMVVDDQTLPVLLGIAWNLGPTVLKTSTNSRSWGCEVSGGGLWCTSGGEEEGGSMGRTCWCVNGQKVKVILPISRDLGTWIFWGLPYLGPLGLARLGMVEFLFSAAVP